MRLVYHMISLQIFCLSLRPQYLRCMYMKEHDFLRFPYTNRPVCYHALFLIFVFAIRLWSFGLFFLTGLQYSFDWRGSSGVRSDWIRKSFLLASHPPFATGSNEYITGILICLCHTLVLVCGVLHYAKTYIRSCI
jgi:hypothetical protein